MSKIRTLLVAGGAVLMVGVIAATSGYVGARPVLVRPGDAPVVERARADAVSALGGGWRDRGTVPVVMRLSDRTCVEFRASRSDGAGGYLVCYARDSGGKLEERAGVGF